MEIKIEDYKIESLCFILEQAEKANTYVLNSYKEINNKSYIAITVYGSVATKITMEVIDGSFVLPFLGGLFFILLGLIPVLILLPNIIPATACMPGIEPDRLIDEYFTYGKKEKQLKKYYAFMIEVQQEMVAINKRLLNKRALCLQYSIYVEVFLLLVSIGSYCSGIA